jgi:hypothetical protein
MHQALRLPMQQAAHKLDNTLACSLKRRLALAPSSASQLYVHADEILVLYSFQNPSDDGSTVGPYVKYTYRGPGHTGIQHTHSNHTHSLERSAAFDA